MGSHEASFGVSFSFQGKFRLVQLLRCEDVRVRSFGLAMGFICRFRHDCLLATPLFDWRDSRADAGTMLLALGDASGAEKFSRVRR